MKRRTALFVPLCQACCIIQTPGHGGTSLRGRSSWKTTGSAPRTFLDLHFACLRSCSLADLQSVTARSTTVSALPPLVCASSFLANLKCILSEVQWFEDLAKEYDVMSCVECAEKY